MSPADVAANLAAYAVQAAAVAGAGLVAPRIFGLRSPRALHILYQAVLLACLSLPFVQPWHERVAPAAGESVIRLAASIDAGELPPGWLRYASIFALGAAATGFLVRLLWVALGLRRLRALRRAAAELVSIPPAVAAECRRIGVTARFFVSPNTTGPATYGLRRPVVMLPVHFFALSTEHQGAIVRHELLHVKRCDWVTTVSEELIRAVFWFHPVVWRLVDRIRLTREQIVDRLAAGRAASRRAYAEALLAVASETGASPLAVPAFAAEPHLKTRISHLLKEVSMSKSRLALSCLLAVSTTAWAGVFAARFFPFDLTASPALADMETPKPARVSGQAKKSAAREDSGDRIYKVGGGVTPPKLLSKIEPKYSEEARDAKVQGRVVLETVIGLKGAAEQIKVVEGLEPSLDKNAIDAVRQWSFEPGTREGKPVRVRATIEVNFKLK